MHQMSLFDEGATPIIMYAMTSKNIKKRVPSIPGYPCSHDHQAFWACPLFGLDVSTPVSNTVHELSPCSWIVRVPATFKLPSSLKKYGITSHHRKGFKPIHKMLSS